MNMISIKFNGSEYSVPRGITILAAAQETQKLIQEFRQVVIPTIYYLKGINDTDESGVCVVEVDGELVNASTTRVKDGMEILTKSEKVMAARKEALATATVSTAPAPPTASCRSCSTPTALPMSPLCPRVITLRSTPPPRCWSVTTTSASSAAAVSMCAPRCRPFPPSPPPVRVWRWRSLLPVPRAWPLPAA